MAVAAAYTFSGFFQVSLIVKVHCKLVDKIFNKFTFLNVYPMTLKMRVIHGISAFCAEILQKGGKKMPSFVISYDLSKPIADYENLTEELKKFSGWCHLHKSVWLVTTTANSEQVYDKLSKHLDKDDKLFVCQLAHKTAVWTNFDKDITNWIKSHC